MGKIMQNLVVLIESPMVEYFISEKSVKMCLNRFCIDEDTAFEVSGVYQFDKGRGHKLSLSRLRSRFKNIENIKVMTLT